MQKFQNKTWKFYYPTPALLLVFSDFCQQKFLVSFSIHRVLESLSTVQMCDSSSLSSTPSTALSSAFLLSRRCRIIPHFDQRCSRSRCKFCRCDQLSILGGSLNTVDAIHLLVADLALSLLLLDSYSLRLARFLPSPLFPLVDGTMYSIGVILSAVKGLFITSSALAV